MTSTGNLKGLVLCGGRSTRMQQDKSTITYHGMPQWQYLAELLQHFLPEVYLSCRAGQSYPGWNRVITDSVEGAGPSAGLLSARAVAPATSWLVLACDLPLIGPRSIEHLLRHRQPEKAATAFISPFNNMPEPLIAIWEPEGLTQLEKDFGEGKTCPRKTLLNTNTAVLHNPFADEQFNANTPEEMHEALQQLR
ncbi:molybdenum cofactor guanylyltransferase [Chitinophaga alhagiae]|uniref:molybdenum cofactor guanylyltransferase n=1 Tax=Chitinophaga alhagiae TaxID=2203219 RepID=UPI000E5B7217|nr:NTP transferase domain-containing protein [Chitinophaga alhagiae]